MPPKLLATFLSGAAGSSPDGAPQEPIYYWSTAPQMVAPATQHFALPPTAQRDVFPVEMVPLSAAPKPSMPVIVSKKVSRLQTRQLWEGTVSDVTADTFTARLIDKTNPENPEETAVFELSEISPEERIFVNPGSPFYLVIGSERTPAGQIKGVSMLHFRRLPGWSRSSLSEIATKAKQLDAVFQDQ